MQKAVDLHPPVTDWTNDWDHLDPQWQNNPFPIWDMLRDKCPVAHTKRFQGAYLPTTYEAVKAIAYDTEHFSSRRIIVRDERAPVENLVPAPPITSDPPHHKAAKQLLLPPFTPDEMKNLEPKARAICNELIDKFAGETLVDAAQAYSRHIPVKVIAHMLGVPDTDSALFIRWIHEILELGIRDIEIATKAGQEMSYYFAPFLQKYAANPADNLISRLLAAKGPNGQPLPPEHVIGALRLLLIAGIDTTWSAIGASLWHLAKSPADRKRLIAEPEIMPLAIEEFLRAYAPVTMAREVVKDTEITGCPVKAGNMILLSFPAANRDPKMFADADKVILDRQENRHGAFGLGIHRCVGSNLARMEMTVALEEWLKRIPEFRLDPSADVKWPEGTVRGPRALPLIIGA